MSSKPHTAEQIRAWLASHYQTERSSAAGHAVFYLLAGLAVLAVTFVVLWILLFVLMLVLRQPTSLSFGLAALATAAVFVGNYLIREDALRQVHVSEHDTAIIVYAPGLTFSGFALISGDGLRHAPKLLAEVLFAGPRLLQVALTKWARAGAAPVENLAPVAYAFKRLWFSSRSVEVNELLGELSVEERQTTLQQLLEIDGVMPLDGPPSKLLLTSELREHVLEATAGSPVS